MVLISDEALKQSANNRYDVKEIKRKKFTASQQKLIRQLKYYYLCKRVACRWAAIGLTLFSHLKVKRAS